MSAPVTHVLIGVTRSILFGGGLAYSVQQEKYHHIPIVLLFPSTYAGYQAFSNKDAIAKWLREKITKEE
jgi:hypothetical protein